MQKLQSNVLKLVLGSCRKFGPKLDLNHPTLISIGFSHFSEKGRWLLDLSPLEYKEDMHLPALHLSRTLSPEIDKQERFAVDVPLLVQCHNGLDEKTRRRKERTGVPKLVLPRRLIPLTLAGNVKSDYVVVKDGSQGIARYLLHAYPQDMQYLFPPEHADTMNSLLQLAEDVLAPAVTTYCFGCILLDKQTARLFVQSASQNKSVPAVERNLISWLGSVFTVPLMIKGNGISKEAMVKAKEDILSALDKLDEHRRKHSSTDKYFLPTEKPTLVDITVASFLAPLLLSPETGRLFLSRSLLTDHASVAQGCADLLSFSNLLREKYTTVQTAVQLYAEDRPRMKGLE